jgi:hypothetical protein
LNRKSVYKLINVLSGIASCATVCPCCRSHAESAAKALKQFERRTQITAGEVYSAVKTAEKLHEAHGTTAAERDS